MIKISYPQNTFSSILIKENNLNNKNYKFFPDSDEGVARLLEKNLVDLALITPDKYAELTKTADFRVLDINLVALDGMAGQLGVESNGFESLNSYQNNTNISYLSSILEILYKERYRSDLKESKKPDIILDYDSNGKLFDLSEDWKDSFNISLPIYIWVARYEDGTIPKEDYLEAIKEICNNNEIYNKDGEREGKIILKWDKFIEKNIDETLELMFYQNYLSELFAVKIYE